MRGHTRDLKSQDGEMSYDPGISPSMGKREGMVTYIGRGYGIYIYIYVYVYWCM